MASQEEIIEIDVPNWEDFQHHNGKRTYDWFKFSSNFFDDHEMRILTTNGKLVWIYILCQCAKMRSRSVKLNLRCIQTDLKVNSNYIKDALSTLEKYQVLTLKSGTNRVPQIRIEENRVNNDQNQSPKGDEKAEKKIFFDFESLYSCYPKKLGKKEGLAICRLRIKSESDFEKLRKAIAKYSTHCHKTRTEEKFIKYFSTFMASWEDWLDEDAGTTVNGNGSHKDFDEKDWEREVENDRGF